MDCVKITFVPQYLGMRIIVKLNAMKFRTAPSSRQLNRNNHANALATNVQILSHNAGIIFPWEFTVNLQPFSIPTV